LNEKQFLHHLNLIKESIEMLKFHKEKFNNIFSLPLNKENILDIKEDFNLKTDLDSIAYRFSKIQSILGEKVFVEILDMLNLDTNKNFIEILSTLEKFNVLKAKEWLKLRKIRNSLSHEYPDELEIIALTINEIFEKIDFFEEIYSKLTEIYNETKKLEGKK